MFGTLRYLLAVLVMVSHLAGWPASGAYAVFGFYALSGYLMTLVLSRTYGFGARAAGRFMLNRILRIYPQYYVVLAIALALVFVLPEFSQSFLPELRLPPTIDSWAHNLLIFGLQSEMQSSLIPPGWSLAVELFFYAVMALGASRSRTTTIIWFAGSLAYTCISILGGASFESRYSPAPAASLPFSLGALIYWVRPAIPQLPSWITYGAPALFIMHALAAPLIWARADREGFYLSLLLFGAALIALAPLRPAQLSDHIVAIDRTLGNLAYPVFLCHWHVGLLVAYALYGEPTRGAAFLLLCLPLTALVALALYSAIERPISQIRDTIRPGRPPL
jgi:peptidoglycan/LPS O-acetylase OafA/YrhL